MQAIVGLPSYNAYLLCLTNTSLPTCVNLLINLNYAWELGINPLRINQDLTGAQVQEDIISLATSGEASQYVMISICSGLVILSTMIILPILMWIIKDKSYVLGIFADVKNDEAKKVIEEALHLDLTKLVYRKKWLEKWKTRQEMFWKKLVDEQRGRKKISEAIKKEEKIQELGEDFSSVVKEQVVQEKETPNEDKSELKSIEEKAKLDRKSKFIVIE